MRQWSNEPKDQGGLHGPERYRKLRRLKDRPSFKIDECKYVRQKIGELNGDQAALRRASHGKKIEFVHAFMAAAERLLSEEKFSEAEARAAQILIQE